jgi:hypothetical protein
MKMSSSKYAFLVGAILGVAITRTPYMADGNLLVTTVLTLMCGTSTLVIWKVFKKLSGL